MRQKYYEQKWLDRGKAVDHAEKVKQAIKLAFCEDGSPRKQERKQSVEMRRPSLKNQQWVDDNTPIGLISTVPQTKNDDSLLDDVSFICVCTLCVCVCVCVYLLLCIRISYLLQNRLLLLLVYHFIIQQLLLIMPNVKYTIYIFIHYINKLSLY
jgi:hypothetical protein